MRKGAKGGGHTGDTPFSILIPAVVDLVKKNPSAISPLTGAPVLVVAAGGISDGRGLAASLSYGAAGVWVGTRFVASKEAGASERHKQALLDAGYDDIIRTTVFSGRPMNVRKTGYLEEWEGKRRPELESLLREGQIPHEVEEERDPAGAHEKGTKREHILFFCRVYQLTALASAHGKSCRFNSSKSFSFNLGNRLHVFIVLARISNLRK